VIFLLNSITKQDRVYELNVMEGSIAM